MEDDIMQQETQDENSGSFLDGWDDDSERAEAVPAGDPEKAAPGDEEADKGGDVPNPDAPEGAPEQSGQPEGGWKEPSAGETGQNAQKPEDEPQAPPAPRTWTIEHMGRPVTISEADVPALARRALEYDRLRTSYDETKPVMDLFRGFAAEAGITVPEYTARLRLQAKQSQGMDEAAARRAVEMEDREARVAAREAEAHARQEEARQFQDRQRRQQERVQADIQEFMAVFPDAARDFQSIPQEVWDAVNGGMSLVAAYARYTRGLAEAQAQQEAKEQQRREAVRAQNRQNAAASAGSMQSAGNNHGPKDPFLEGWDE